MDPDAMRRAQWFNYAPYDYPLDKPFDIMKQETMYWRLSPQPADWVILVVMGTLNDINHLYAQKDEVRKRTRGIHRHFNDDYARANYYWARTKRVLTAIFTYVVVAIMIFLQVTLETNLITWLFFILNMC